MASWSSQITNRLQGAKSSSNETFPKRPTARFRELRKPTRSQAVGLNAHLSLLIPSRSDPMPDLIIIVTGALAVAAFILAGWFYYGGD
jgi:hypothetical protein